MDKRKIMLRYLETKVDVEFEAKLDHIQLLISPGPSWCQKFNISIQPILIKLSVNLRRDMARTTGHCAP